MAKLFDRCYTCIDMGIHMIIHMTGMFLCFSYKFMLTLVICMGMVPIGLCILKFGPQLVKLFGMN